LAIPFRGVHVLVEKDRGKGTKFDPIKYDEESIIDGLNGEKLGLTDQDLEEHLTLEMNLSELKNALSTIDSGEYVPEGLTQESLAEARADLKKAEKDHEILRWELIDKQQHPFLFPDRKKR
jgi:hypothetical protein